MHDFFDGEAWSAWLHRYRWRIRVAGCVAIFLSGAVFAWSLMPAGRSTPSPPDGGQASPQSAATVSEASTKPAAQWYTCAMHPQIRQRKPGKCPICRMDLVPVEPSAGGLRTLVMRPEVKELLKIQTVPVERRYVTAKVRMVGKLDYDETRLAHITAWVAGRLDRLFVNYTGVQVRQGDHMVYMYSEELYTAQEELIQALRFQRENPNAGRVNLVESAREKLRLLGLTEQQIREIEERGRAEDHVTIYAPTSGIVIQKLRQEGDRVNVGDRIYTVADLSHLWLRLDAYESDLPWIRYGQQVTFTTAAYPGEIFTGRISFIDPVLNAQTRTVKVRVNVDNASGRLKPEMFVHAVIESKVAAGGRVLDPELAGKWISPMHPEIVKDGPGFCDICGMPLVRAEALGFVAAETDPQEMPLVIPVSAALVTGTRAIVYVELEGTDKPTFEGREVLLGPRAGDHYIVRHGLFEGERVVINGNFKIDSELQIQAKPTMMTPDGGGGGGHDHGGGPQPKSGGTSSTMVMNLPDSFVQQVREMLAVASQVELELKTEDIEAVRAAFQHFRRKLDLIHAEKLAGHPAMVWREFLMRLSNDAIEGSEAPDMDTARRVVQSLRHNLNRLQQQLMLDHASHSAHADHASQPAVRPATIELPDWFRQQLATVYAGYFAMRKALAADDLVAAQAAASQLSATFAQLSGDRFEPDQRAAWEQESRQLAAILTALQQAPDIAAVRTQFSLLSDQLLAMALRFRPMLEHDVFELHCPMAFEGRGATWLQENDQAGNPYYGSKMLSCADKIQRIELLQSVDPSATDPAEEVQPHD
ncbi:MAG: hypothetical protein KatS3mg111_4122 [Pirellulaceae bacterium]|nr:MAG: hypothetical protein KatS3mg111_4122 [Pirellulaceae bacterium]